ncbi:hypothetical protein ACOME3_008195 [Neoechinorhynchus agilis]
MTFTPSCLVVLVLVTYKVQSEGISDTLLTTKADWFSMYYREPGESLNVDCEKHDGLWYHIPFGKSITKPFGPNPLIITSINGSHAGLFVCASKSSPKDRRFLFLTTSAYELLDPSWEGEGSAIVGEPLRRQCVIRQEINYTVSVKLTIRKDSAVHDVITDNSILFIDKLKYEHEGMYVCLLKTAGGSYAARAFHLRPEGVPALISTRESVKFVKDGETGVVLECPVYGIPVPSITWKFNGQSDPAIPNKPTILLDKVNSSKQGIYECFATNRYGTSSGNVELIVAGPPENIGEQVAPDIISEHNKTFMVAKCPIGSRIDTVYQWKLKKHHGKEIEVFGQNEGFARIEIRPDEVEYLICEAANIFGNTSANVQTKVISKREERQHNYDYLEMTTVQEHANNKIVADFRLQSAIRNSVHGVELTPDLQYKTTKLNS